MQMVWGHLYIQAIRYVQVPVILALRQIKEDAGTCPYQGASRMEPKLHRLSLIFLYTIMGSWPISKFSQHYWTIYY